MFVKTKRWNRAEVWDNHKAGVIDIATGQVIVPVRYDELYWRVQTFRSPAPGVPPEPPLLVGFACFTDEGEAVAYDADGKPDEWKDWELGRLSSPELPSQTLQEIEDEILRRYNDGAGRDDLYDLIYDRVRLLNSSWRHTPENVSAISRINDRLNNAVREALKMGETVAKTLTGDWVLTVEVYPEWEDDAIQNLLAELGRNVGVTRHSPCFTLYVTEGSSGSPDIWDFKKATLDDGRSWDEGGFSRPAYQDCYFVHPFQQLSHDNYALAFSDLLEITTFQINILINKEASK